MYISLIPNAINLKQSRLRDLVQQEQDEWEMRLKALMTEAEKNKWKRITEKMDKSEIGCKNQAKQMGLSK